MKNPCYDCGLLLADKNNPDCLDCSRRIDYAKGISQARHFIREEKMESISAKEQNKEVPVRPPQAAMPLPKPPEKQARAEKACKKCHQVKPLEDFVKNPECVNGREGSCKLCRKKATIGYYAKRKAKKLVMELGREAAEPPAPDPAPEASEPVRERPVVTFAEALANASRNLTDFFAAPETDSVQPPGDPTANHNLAIEELLIAADPLAAYFAEYPDKHAQLEAIAKAEFRTPEAQAIYFIHRALAEIAERFLKQQERWVCSPSPLDDTPIIYDFRRSAP